MKFSIKYYKSS